MSPQTILREKFGYESFRLHQEAIIQSVLQKKDTLAIMPTGGGKSLCYQIPALINNGLTLVISPLIALMKDQVDALRVNGVEAAFLNSTQTSREQSEVYKKADEEKLKLLYLAPEKLFYSDSFLKTLRSWKVSLVAIDEAHCISHWGHDFRPEYLMLARLKNELPNISVVALTATADKLVRKDIVDKLELRDPDIYISSFNRENIRYTVESKSNSFGRLLDFIQHQKNEPGIIYCLSRNGTETLAKDLQDQGFSALPYHAGLERDVRTQHQDMFLCDQVNIIVATIAFGMGINKSNVRYVVHMDLPKNVESYYQETGRAGRDGLPSEALLFYSRGDVVKMKRLTEIKDNPEQSRIFLKKLDQMGDYGELVTCRRKYILNYFDESTSDYCGNCDACLTRFEQTDETINAQKVLSAVSRLDESFGTGYVIDFLKGSASSKIKEWHKTLKTFGVGKDLTREAWQEIIRQLTAAGYLAKSDGVYPILQLTEKSDAVLKGKEKVMLAKARERINVENIEQDYEPELFEQLKGFRYKLALQENVPAYIILSDATLRELATYLPLTKEAFRKILGFGEIKLEKYGKNFAEVVFNYCKERNLTTRIHKKGLAKARTTIGIERDSDTKKTSLELFNQGNSIADIAAARSLSASTIENHLAFYITKGILSIEQLIDMTRMDVIQDAIKQVGGVALTPIKQKLGDSYSFGEIRFVMAHLEYLASQSSG